MEGINTWDIWLAKVEFEDVQDIKIRPVVVIKEDIVYVLSIKLTTHEPRYSFSGEYRLQFWKESGLKCQTTARLTKTLRIDKNNFIKKIGRLHPTDRFEIYKCYMQMKG